MACILQYGDTFVGQVEADDCAAQRLPGTDHASSGQYLMGYAVDNDGFIDFPVLGKVRAAGFNRWQLQGMIQKELLDRKLLNDAIVTVDFMNFKVSIMGEVTAPGTYTINSDKVTVLEAIAMAKDLTIFGEDDKALDLYAKYSESDRIRELLIRNSRKNPESGYYIEMRRYYFMLSEADILSNVYLMSAMSMLYSMMLDFDKSEYWYKKLTEYRDNAKGSGRREDSSKATAQGPA